MKKYNSSLTYGKIELSKTNPPKPIERSYVYMIPHKQLSLTEFFSDCQTKFENDKPQSLSLLKNTININKLIPYSFVHNFYASTGRPRRYPLYSMLWALILQRVLSIPADTLLMIFLKY